MKVIKPEALKKGNLIGICAPASPTKNKKILFRGISYLEGIGYRIKLGDHIFDKNGYLAGDDKSRAHDFNNMVSDKKVKAIFFTRGGYGSSRILSLINFKNIKKNPKIIVGYSDITAIQLAIFRETGLVTFNGPMVAPDLSKKFSGEVEEFFWRILSSNKCIGSISKYCGSETETLVDGKVEGRLLGGNLSIISSLVGTGYLPSFNDNILMTEDVQEAPYRIDRMLQQLRMAGILKNISGALLGDFSTCKAEKGKPSLSVNQIFKHFFKNVPSLSNIQTGHVADSMPYAHGVHTQIDTRGKKIIIDESAVI
jgi:muramoyltetrapeptide carboxypeptidase